MTSAILYIEATDAQYDDFKNSIKRFSLGESAIQKRLDADVARGIKASPSSSRRAYGYRRLCLPADKRDDKLVSVNNTSSVLGTHVSPLFLKFMKS